MEKIYIVEGWDGDMEVFHNRDNALVEFNRRLAFADEYVLDFEDDGYIEYHWYDKVYRQVYYLTFTEINFSD